jgi:hypothetical protein
MTLTNLNPPGVVSKAYTARPPGPLAGAVVVTLWINLAAHAISGVAQLLQLLDIMPGQAGVLLSGLAALVQLLVFLVSGFLSLKWIYRVQMNAHTLATGLSNTPPWAIGWFFVPFANLYKPFQALKEAWQVSLSPHDWRSARPPGLINWWWGLWIVTGILGNLSFRFSTMDADMRAAGDWISVFADVCEIPLGLLFIEVVRGLTRDQTNALEGDTFG